MSFPYLDSVDLTGLSVGVCMNKKIFTTTNTNKTKTGGIYLVSNYWNKE